MSDVNDMWSSQQTLAQYGAVAWLRWRMLLNLQRRSNSAGEIAGRVVLYCIMLGGGTTLTIASGSAAWLLAGSGHLAYLPIEFWGIFLVCQLLNINLGQPGTTLNPTDLVRFPMRARTYIAIRLFFNLLSPANVMAMLMSLAAAIGITLAMPALAVYAFAACIIFGVTNVLFSRMVFAWVDRWLSTRRARELFTFAILFFSLGIQYLNFTYNSAFGGRGHHDQNTFTHAHVSAGLSQYHRLEAYLQYLPPHLAGNALTAAQARHVESFLGDVAGCALYGVLFLFIFAARTRTEFRGEALGDDASGVRAIAKPLHRAATPASVTASVPSSASGHSLLTSPMIGVLGKEWIYTRRNIGLLYGVVTPLFLVIMAAVKWGHNTPSTWVLPIALMYSLFGIAPQSYNSFGLESTGAQVYFMAPISLRDVFLAKNLLHFGLALAEIVAVIAIVTYVSAFPSPLLLVSMLLWAAGTLLLNTTLGNRRSVTAPKRVEISRMAGKQASQTSGLISLGVLLACGAFGAGVLLLAGLFSLPWLPLPCFAALAVAGALVYRRGLRSVDTFTREHRDALFAELSKA